MTVVARKLAMVRAAVQQVKKIEDRMLAKRPNEAVFKQAMTDLVDAALKAQGWTEEAVAVLQGIKRNVEGYLRELRRATD